jgi:hypothetical protein
MSNPFVEAGYLVVTVVLAGYALLVARAARAARAQAVLPVRVRQNERRDNSR